MKNNKKKLRKLNGINSTRSSFRRIKLFGVKLGEVQDSSLWNLDELPNILELEHLEISNLASLSSSNYGSHDDTTLNEFKLKKSTKLNKLRELHLKNNQIKFLNRE